MRIGLAVTLALIAVVLVQLVLTNPTGPQDPGSSPTGIAPARHGAGDLDAPGDPRARTSVRPGEQAGAAQTIEVRIRVMASSGQPCDAARVAACIGSRAVDLGVTDRSGELTAILPDTGDGSILAKDASGTRAAEYRWSGATPPVIVLTLGPALEIAGRIESLDGVLPASGVEAVAIPEALRGRELSSLGQLLGWSEVVTAPAGADGAFRLQGLLDGVTYDVLAVAVGYVSTGYSHGALAGVTDARVQIARLYGRRVVLRELEGGELRTSSLLFAQQPPSWRVSDARAIPVHELSGQLRLLTGLEPASLAPGGQHDRLFLYTSSEHNDVIDGLEYFGDVPGYGSFQERISLPALEPLADVPVSTVRLQRETAGWGRLRVAFDGAVVGQIRSAPDCDLFGILHLVRASGPGLEFAIRAPTAEGTVQDGIPWGDYDVAFVSSTGLYRWPAAGQPQVLVHLGGEDARLQVSLEQMGALRLDPGPARDGPVPERMDVGIYAEGNPDPFRATVCAENDYLLAGLIPWSYRVEVTWPRRSQRSELVRVEGGNVGQVRVKWAE